MCSSGTDTHFLLGMGRMPARFAWLPDCMTVTTVNTQKQIIYCIISTRRSNLYTLNERSVLYNVYIENKCVGQLLTTFDA